MGLILPLPDVSKQGLRVHCDSLDSGLCQCGLRSGASLQEVVMFLTDSLLKYVCPHLEFPVFVCTEPHPAQKRNKTLDVFFTAGYSQRGTNLYCQWHQILRICPARRLQMAPHGHKPYVDMGFGRGQFGPGKYTSGHLPNLKTFIRMILSSN